MTFPKIHCCKFCGDIIDAQFRCWNIDCKFAGVSQEPPRAAGAVQPEHRSQVQAQHDSLGVNPNDLCVDEGCPQHGIPHVCVTLSPAAHDEVAALETEVAKQKLKLGESTRTIPMHADEELKLIDMYTFGKSGAHVSLQFNRVITDHERVSLEMMIRLFLKGYANAR